MFAATRLARSLDSKCAEHKFTNSNFGGLHVHPHRFCKRRFYWPSAKKNDMEWANLKAVLAERGPDKSVEQWKNTWRDLKKKARSEMATHKRSLNITGNKEPVPVISDISNKIMDIIGLASAIGIGPMESIIDIGSSEQDTAVSLPMEPHSSGHSSTMNPAPASLEQIQTLGVKKMIKRRKQYRPVADFANIQRETNEILKKFADDMVAVLKERNKIEKERKIEKKEMPYLGKRNGSLASLKLLRIVLRPYARSY
ncbi:hypothetical protein EVAR_69016_1 [Eumeta japonica]|uniref:Regulatory protein zeste n=1 Tax=Eumeta variegata TaxID=151549 RepID=A0A4C1SRB7_EUMVA|nr:hypothetical protein EVAR_69016_1 [Eumeta japonica]